MCRCIILTSLVFAFHITLNAQLGGSSTYAFLNLPNSARAASLGGNPVAINDDDLNMAFYNPSLLNSRMDNNFAVNYVGYFAGINYGYASYAKDYGTGGTYAAGIHYVNYGEFIAADEFGYKTGTFSASEIALNLIYSKNVDSLLSIGFIVKPVYSHLEKYTSIGILADGGITYYNPDKLFTAAFVIRNVGTQLIRYHKGSAENMPFEIQAGFSQKLKYAPFRFSILLQHLQKLDVDNYRTNNQKSGQDLPERGFNKLENFGDKLMKHVVFGIELLPAENLYISFGYNYKRRQELKIPEKAGMAGFSWGFGIKIKKFRVSYGRAVYHVAGASNHFSMSFDLSEFYKSN